jgi:hypothetical protein
VLDPKDWAAFRATSHAMLDQAIDYLENVREAPAWRAVPDDVRAQLMEPLPQEPTELVASHVLVLPTLMRALCIGARTISASPGRAAGSLLRSDNAFTS